MPVFVLRPMQVEHLKAMFDEKEKALLDECGAETRARQEAEDALANASALSDADKEMEIQLAEALEAAQQSRGAAANQPMQDLQLIYYTAPASE
jgi:hypothetical protein